MEATMGAMIALRRANARRRHRAAAANGPSTSALKNTVLTSLAALLVTAFFGDFIVKRNIDTYLRQLEDFETSLSRADEGFSKFYYDLESRIRERRRLAQLLNSYATDEAYHDFAENYTAYDLVKDEWSAKLQETANEIVRMTNCKNVASLDPSELQTLRDAFREIVNRAKKIFADLPVDLVSSQEVEHIVENEFCPTYFLTLNRSSHAIKRAEPISVHEHFLEQNKILYNFRLNSYTNCQIRFLGYHDSFVRSCFARWTVKSAMGCIVEVDRVYAANDSCFQFERERAGRKTISDPEFDKFDYRWYRGKEFLQLFRKGFDIRQCEQSRGFWAHVLRWDCRRQYEVSLAGGKP
jgi:hypothetical protein